MLAELLPRISALSIEEKRELVRLLEEELALADQAVDPAIVELLEERMAHYRANPETAISWEEAKERLRSGRG